MKQEEKSEKEMLILLGRRSSWVVREQQRRQKKWIIFGILMHLWREHQWNTAGTKTRKKNVFDALRMQRNGSGFLVFFFNSLDRHRCKVQAHVVASSSSYRRARWWSTRPVREKLKRWKNQTQNLWSRCADGRTHRLAAYRRTFSLIISTMMRCADSIDCIAMRAASPHAAPIKNETELGYFVIPRNLCISRVPFVQCDQAKWLKHFLLYLINENKKQPNFIRESQSSGSPLCAHSWISFQEKQREKELNWLSDGVEFHLPKTEKYYKKTTEDPLTYINIDGDTKFLRVFWCFSAFWVFCFDASRRRARTHTRDNALHLPVTVQFGHRRCPFHLVHTRRTQQLPKILCIQRSSISALYF